MQNLFTIASFILGSIIGSFLNVVILRLPREQSLNGRSHCPHCHRTLQPLDLVPVFSFLFLRGRCRFCRSKISWRYFVIEFICGLLFAWAWVLLKPANLVQGIELIKYWLALGALLTVFVIDFEHYLILDTIVFPVSVLMVVLNLVLDLSGHPHLRSGNLVSGILGAAAMVVPFFLLWFASSGRLLGFGDVKLAILLGLILGWPLVLVGFMAGVILGGVVGIFLLVFGGKTLKSQVPFGTFLSIGAVFGLFYGHSLLQWYLAFLRF